ncbi:MAG: hypothetical protein EBW60_12785 [Rhodobacteraceae bacterium]|nr:hypothetical protein [Paracoccaceae bacterium]
MMSDFDLDLEDDVSLYANLFGFLSAPVGRERKGAPADVAVLGAPYDLGTTGRSGTRSGPAAIRQASGNLRWEEARWPWTYALADHLRLIDLIQNNFQFPEQPMKPWRS